MRRFQVVALSLGCVMLAGCPFLMPTPGVLSGSWSGTTEEGIDVTITFDNNNRPTQIEATNAEGQSATLVLNNATTTIDGSDVTVTIPVGSQSAIYNATLSTDQNTLEGSVTSAIEVGGGDATVIIDAGDLTLTRDGQPECETDEDCEQGEVCSDDGECVAETTDCTTLTGMAAAGETFYTGNGCANCHAADGSGGIGPNVRESTCLDMLDALTNNAAHPMVETTDQDAADLVAYLDSVCSTDEDCGEGEVCNENGECVADTSDCTDLTGDATAGETFYNANGCSNCHGATPTGLSGTDCQTIFNKLSGAVSHVGGVVDGVTEQDAADLEAYFGSL